MTLPAPGSPLRRPPPLRPGDRVALISPSSHQGRYPPEYLADAVSVLRGWDLSVDPVGEPPRHLYLAGTDAQRAAQFQRAYTDPAVKALFCARGGYGAARLLPLLDREAIAAAGPKWVVGFSDVTSLFAYLHGCAGTVALHGPCLAAPGAITSPRKLENQAALRKALFDAAPRADYAVQWLHRPPGAASAVSGPVIGGCLAVLVTTLGTPWEIDTRDAILYLEDTDEAPYRIDRMLTHLRTAGKLERVRAVVFGYLQRCDSDPPGLLHDVLRDLFRAAAYPVATGLPCGHGDLNLPLELGARHALSAEGEGGRLRRE
jgi:muramoyltetrapeptide carboxypeptidase